MIILGLSGAITIGFGVGPVIYGVICVGTRNLEIAESLGLIFGAGVVGTSGSIGEEMGWGM